MIRRCLLLKMKRIKEVMPDAFIGVDVIVGTRGETEEYFEQAYRFIQSLDVTQLHVFSYSERPGTQALKDRACGVFRGKAQTQPASAGFVGRKDTCVLCPPYRADNACLLERSKPGTPMHGFLRIISGWKCRMMMRWIIR